MNDLKDGKYIILPAGHRAPPPFPVGANLQGSGRVEPVVVAGRDHVWLVCKHHDGTYALSLKKGETPWLSQPGRDDVVVGTMPGPGEWVIQKQEGQDSNVYTIEVPSFIIPTRAWTLRDTRPGTKVELGFVETPTPDQLWRFIPLFDE